MTRENSGFARFVGRVASAIALLAVVAGGLWVLLHWGRLDGWTSVNWRDVWAQPDDGRLLLGVLTAVGWLAWVLVVGTVLCEAVAALSRGRLRPRMPGSGWLRPAIAGLVITILGLSSASALMGHQPLGSAVGDDAPTWQASGPVDAPVKQATTELTSTMQTTVPYVVQAGDDLWSLAEQFAGGGENWRAIAQANDTVVLDPGVELTPGTMLMVPQVSGVSPQAGASAVTLVRATMPQKTDGDEGVETVAVQQGDTLWGLSEANLGDGLRWPEIYDANQAVIANPDLIYPGQTLVMPSGLQESVPNGDDAGDNTPAETGPAEVTNETTGEVPGETSAGADQGSMFGYAAQLGAGAGQVTASTVSVPKVSTAGEVQITDGEPSPNSLIASLLGSIGVGLAAALVVGIGANRLIQLRERPVGRSLPRMTPSMQEFETALDRRARDLLGRAEDDDDDAEWVRPVVSKKEEVPVGEPMLSLVSDEDDPGVVDATVCLGSGATGDEVSLNLVDAGLVQVLGGEPQALGLMAAMAGQVFDGPVEGRPEIMLAASKLDWLAALLDCPLMPAEVAASLVNQRLAATGVATEQLVVFTDGYMPKVGKGSGITVVSSWYRDRRPDADVAVEVDDTDKAKLWVAGHLGPVFQAQLVAAPARRMLAELADNVTSLKFPKAPWWAESDASGVVDSVSRAGADASQLGGRPNLVALDGEDDAFAHPVLRLFGPVTLTGARGVAPSQATKQCLEYCGWLLKNPGQTSTTMARALFVAEATRRSNLSRLRLWLGCDDAGEPYLPDAYSGRIVLHKGVTCDWDRMNVLVGGVNRASEHSLIDALRLVRGAPLADAAPGQWRWAEEWRCDMVSLARDIAAVLCDRALARDDVELARWAVHRGLLAAPADVMLLTAQVRVEMQAGTQAEVERLAAALTHRASRAGFDLPDATASLLQEALEGGRRTRLAA
ncbi:MAG: LysM peptidoglycan-binding domain-containing protein [Propionibacteriaceae bacterium]|nr:LysM peptidoglycan-binding domain-containing protein [Propionibacteriaceae bacterium]